MSKSLVLLQILTEENNFYLIFVVTEESTFLFVLLKA